MPDKYTQLSHASNPFIYGHDSWKFASVQLAKVCNPEFVTSKPGTMSVEKSLGEGAARRGTAVLAETPFGDGVILIEVVDPGFNLLVDFRQFQHRLFRSKSDEFLRLGPRVAFEHEIAL